MRKWVNRLSSKRPASESRPYKSTAESAHEQAQPAEVNLLCRQTFRSLLTYATLVRSCEGARFKRRIRRYSQADDASAISEIEDARLSPSASLGIKAGATRRKTTCRNR